MKSHEDLYKDLNVSISSGGDHKYNGEPPYSPHHRYPEYIFDSLSRENNPAYDAVRNALLLLGMDKEHYGMTEWNPLKEIVLPGDRIVIKPNFVASEHGTGGDLYSVITHPSVLRAIIDFVYISLNGRGSIVIADAPQMDCNFKYLMEKTSLMSISELYSKEKGFGIEIYDMRDFWLESKPGSKAAYSFNRHALPGDPAGSVLVDLGKDSLFYSKGDPRKYYGADYDRRETLKYHDGDVQQYVISRTILGADAVILVPKLKVHKKVGVTLNIKGLVGTAVNKNCLVHYILGSPSVAGDQFPDGLLSQKDRLYVGIKRSSYDLLLSKKNPFIDSLYEEVASKADMLLKWLGLQINAEKASFDSGNWYGNDSAWRMAADLLRIFTYSSMDGTLQHKPVRRVFSIVDGIVGGEGDGPLSPDRKECGVIVAGYNPGAVDIVCARLMGFDPVKIKMLAHVLECQNIYGVGIDRIRLHYNDTLYASLLNGHTGPYYAFKPHSGWVGHIEVTDTGQAGSP